MNSGISLPTISSIVKFLLDVVPILMIVLGGGFFAAGAAMVLWTEYKDRANRRG